MSNKKWEVIIPQSEHIEYWKKIIEITDIANTSLINEEYPTLKGENNYPSLMAGYTSQALYYSVLQHLQPDFDYKPTVKNLILNVLRALDKSNVSFTFSDGIAGFGWLLNFVKNELSENVDSYLTKLDNSLFDLSINLMKNKNYDFLHGSLGILYYYIERNNYKYVDILTDYLINLRIERNNKSYWEYFDFEAQKISENCVSFGVAHGMPSILLILSKVYQKRLYHSPDSILPIIKSGVKFLISNQNKDSNSVFPCQLILDKNQEEYSPLGWCFGDLSIAYLLYQIGELINDNDLMKSAIDIGLSTLKRTNLPENGIFDSCLCHGTSGLAHIYNRFYQSTKRIEFKNQALFWYGKTLDIATYSDGIAGYKTRFMVDNKSVYKNDLSLLNGALGVSLAFMSGISSHEPEWDSILLLN